MITPKDSQVCAVVLKGREQAEFAVWDTSYSIYGAGGHFRFADGGMAGLPVDVAKWVGTHWLVTETADIATPWHEPEDTP
jgi:hypothetical protein